MLLNKINNSILLFFVLALFIGCSYTPLPEQHFKDGSVLVREKSDGSTRFVATTTNMKNYDNMQVGKRIIELKEAAYYGKAKGYKYFAINTPHFNNLLGFPITTINDFIYYCNYPTVDLPTIRKRHDGNCGEDYITDVFFFKEEPKTFPVWNIEEVINEKIDLLNSVDNDGMKALVDYLKLNSIPYMK